MSNVIDFKSRSKSQDKPTVNNLPSAGVVDITEARAQMIQADRRQVKRTILTEFVSVHAVIPNYGLMKVQLYDINDKGLAFDIDEAMGKYNIGEELELRIYLNHQTYFKINSKIAHVTFLTEEGMIRHGCTFIHDSVNNDALVYFIKFLESVTANLKRDGGDILVSKINS